MKFLNIIFDFLIYCRESVYFEAYKAEVKSGSESHVMPVLLIGVFDSPLIFLLLLLMDNIFMSGSIIHNNFPSGISSASSILFAVFVISFELFYYRGGRYGQEIVSKFQAFSPIELSRAKFVGLSYAGSTLVGGGLLIYYVW